MATVTGDFWPADFSPVNTGTPLAIMHQAAGQLGPKTNNLVEARVSTNVEVDGNLRHRFILVAPALDNYTYCLFAAKHGAEPYPVTVVYTREGSPTQETSDGEASFSDMVRGILGSEHAKNVVQGLIAQSSVYAAS